MVKLNWTDAAIQDLKEIHDYIALDSKLYANRFTAKLISRADQLLTMPESGRVVPEFANPEIRELIEGNYRIVYKYVGQLISILRIHHSSRLLINILY